MSDAKYKLMTEQLRLTNSDEEVANYIRWIIKTAQNETEWVSVEDRLPIEFVTVLFCFEKESKGMNNIIKTGCCTGNSWSAHGGKPLLPTHVTHWMPLPKKPNI